MFNVARTGTSGTQVTTGVRGLDAEQIANAQPNPAELAKLEKFAADRDAAAGFAAQGKLSRDVGGLPEMKTLLFFAALAFAATAHAQFRLPSFDINKMVDTVKNVGKAVKDIDEPEEIAIGKDVASRLLGAAPLVADARLQRYVNHVGRWLAAQTERPDLPWQFGVLDSPQRERLRRSRRHDLHHARAAGAGCATRPSSPACSATRSCTCCASTT